MTSGLDGRIGRWWSEGKWRWVGRELTVELGEGEGERMTVIDIKTAAANKHKKVNFLNLVDDDGNQMRVDPEDFHVPVSDTHGHSERFQFRGLNQLKAMVMEVVQTKQFPYRSDSDLLRHALVRHMRWLTDLGYIGKNSIFTADAIISITRDDEIHQEFVVSIDKLVDRVNYHRHHKDDEAADEMIETVWGLIEQLPEENRWKKRYRDEMEAKFGERKK